MPMKLKTVTIENKVYAEVNEDKPVYIHDDGKEVAFDAPQTVANIASRAEQSNRVETENKQLKDQLKTFEGIDNPEAAKHALETMKNIDESKLIAAGKVDEIRKAARTAADEQVAAAQKKAAADLDLANKKAEQLQAQLYEEKIGGSFSRSKYIAERLTLPADIAKDSFGKNFKVEEGKIVSYGPDGNKLYSRAKPGELADFEESMELLVEAYPFRDNILKGKGGGSGGKPANGGGNRADKTLTRGEFDALDPVAKSARMGEGYTVVDA